MSKRIVTSTIPLGQWSLTILVFNDNTEYWPDYRTTLALSNTHMDVDTLLETVKANKMFITGNYKVVNNSITTKFDTIHDTRIDCIPKGCVAEEGLSPRIRADIAYIRMYCEYYQK